MRGKTPSGLQAGSGGSVVVWRYGHSGKLEKLQTVDSFGSNPAMITISPDGKYAIVAHHGQANCAAQTRIADDGYEMVPVYLEPSVVLFARRSDGTLNPEPLDVFGIDNGEKEPYKNPSWRMSHMHSCVWAPSALGSFFVVCDKGTNHIYTMQIKNAKLELIDDLNMINTCDETDPCLQAKPDPRAKPRYVRFHPKKRYFFVNYEAANQVDVFSYSTAGKIKHINTAAVIDMDRRTANENMKGYRFEAQDLKISQDGKYL